MFARIPALATGDSDATYWSTIWLDWAKTAAQNAIAEKMMERMLGKSEELENERGGSFLQVPLSGL